MLPAFVKNPIKFFKQNGPVLREKRADPCGLAMTPQLKTSCGFPAPALAKLPSGQVRGLSITGIAGGKYPDRRQIAALYRLQFCLTWAQSSCEKLASEEIPSYMSMA
jgi:hypothetical protein